MIAKLSIFYTDKHTNILLTPTVGLMSTTGLQFHFCTKPDSDGDSRRGLIGTCIRLIFTNHLITLMMTYQTTVIDMRIATTPVCGITVRDCTGTVET